MKLRVFLIVILLSCLSFCSTAQGEFDIHPDYLLGQKFFHDKGDSRYYFILNNVQKVRLIKKVEITFTEYFLAPVLLNSFGGARNKNLEKIFIDELVLYQSQIDFAKEYMIIHNINLSMQTNLLLEFSNNYLPGGWLGRYVPWKGTAEIGAINKVDFKKLLFIEDKTSPEPQKNSFKNIVRLKDGKIFNNVATTEKDDTVIITSQEGTITIIKKSELEDVK